MIASCPRLDTTPRAGHENQAHGLICCERQRQRCPLQKPLSREQLCVPFSLPTCPRWMSSLTLLGHSAVRDPPATLSDIPLHTTLPQDLQSHYSLICGIQIDLSSSDLSGFGWEMGTIPAICMAEGTWSRGGRKPSAGGGMLLSTGSVNPATPQGAQDLLYFNKTLPSYGNFNFRVVSPCPNLSLPCHPCRSAL